MVHEIILIIHYVRLLNHWKGLNVAGIHTRTHTQIPSFTTFQQEKSIILHITQVCPVDGHYSKLQTKFSSQDSFKNYTFGWNIELTKVAMTSCQRRIHVPTATANEWMPYTCVWSINWFVNGNSLTRCYAVTDGSFQNQHSAYSLGIDITFKFWNGKGHRMPVLYQACIFYKLIQHVFLTSINI